MKKYDEPIMTVTTFSHENILTASAVTQALQEEINGYKSGTSVNIQDVAYIIDWTI